MLAKTGDFDHAEAIADLIDSQSGLGTHGGSAISQIAARLRSHRPSRKTGRLDCRSAHESEYEGGSGTCGQPTWTHRLWRPIG